MGLDLIVLAIIVTSISEDFHNSKLVILGLSKGLHTIAFVSHADGDENTDVHHFSRDMNT